jgi:hypothetical protein
MIPSNECIRLIRKLRWIGMDDEALRCAKSPKLRIRCIAHPLIGHARIAVLGQRPFSSTPALRAPLDGLRD